jgi:ribonuclease J
VSWDPQKTTLRLLPIGGLDTIGANCLALELADSERRSRLLIDCGVSFPVDDYGVELYRPRLELLFDAPEALATVVLTHGHEDHIGALTELLALWKARGWRLPDIVGPGYALALCRRRLEERDLGDIPLRVVSLGEPIALGPFELETVRMTHSIADATALVLRTPVGTVVHSGDFKLDDQPPDGEASDLARLRQIGDDGVALFLSDSTNVMVPGRAGRESLVVDAIARAVAGASGRVLVGIFASNVYRLQAAIDAAAAQGRKVVLLGRSVRTHFDVARELGLLQVDDTLFTSPEIARSLPRDQVLYVAGGTQGEGRGALCRIANGSHGQVSLQVGDRVVLSSRVVPGNERRVLAMENELLGRGVELVGRGIDRELHVSGHAHADEQRELIETLRPRCFVPVHGTRQHLARHAALAREAGVTQVTVLYNGHVGELRDAGVVCLDKREAGLVPLAAGTPVDEEVLRERRQLGRGGMVFVLVLHDDGMRLRDVLLEGRGVPDFDRLEPQLLRVARRAFAQPRGLEPAESVRRAVRKALPGGGSARAHVAVRLAER